MASRFEHVSSVVVSELPAFKLGGGISFAVRANGLDYPPRSTVVALSTQLHASLVATGRYLGILPGAMLWFGGKRLPLRVLPVDLPIQPKLRSVGIVTLKNRTLSAVAQLFIQLCTRSRETASEGAVSMAQTNSDQRNFAYSSHIKSKFRKAAIMD